MTAAFQTTGVEVIERNKRAHKTQAAADKACDAAMNRNPDANIGEVYEAFGAWHWYVGYDWDEVNAEREAAEKAVQS